MSTASVKAYEGELKLKLAKNLRFRIDSQGQILARVSATSGEFVCDSSVFSLLKTLSNASTLDAKKLAEETKKILQHDQKSALQANEVKLLLQDLVEAGVLIDSSQTGGMDDGFADPWIQWDMICDKNRWESYAKAASQHVTLKSKVLDVGCGTGALSAICLHAGASHVYGIEETKVGSVANKVTKKLLKPGQKFSLLAGNSHEIKLPSVDVVISELFGNDPFSEGILPTLRDIAERCSGKPTFIPQKCEVFVEAIATHASRYQERLDLISSSKEKSFYEQFLSECKKNLDFDSCSFPTFLRAEDFERKSKPVLIAEAQLCPPIAQKKEIGKKVSFKNHDYKDANSALMWYRVTLTKGVTLSNHPLEKDYCDHWSPILMPFLSKPTKEEVVISSFMNDEENHLHVEIKTSQQVIANR